MTLKNSSINRSGGKFGNKGVEITISSNKNSSFK